MEGRPLAQCTTHQLLTQAEVWLAKVNCLYMEIFEKPKEKFPLLCVCVSTNL